MIKFAAIGIAAIGLLLVIPGASQAKKELAGELAVVTPSSCPIPVPDSKEIECGYLEVPADRINPASTKMRLPYIIIHSHNPNPAADPLIFTQGGPGYSSLGTVWDFSDSPLGDDRDVIIFEQRGNLYAEPALTCDRTIWWEEADGNTPCLDSLKAEEIEFNDYTSANIAADIVALRKALGYEQWNLYGSSYSTTLMLLVMEMDPEGVRSTILQSVRPPQKSIFNHEADHVARSLDLLFADCAADPGCSKAFPDLEDQFYELIHQLNEEPIEIQVYDRSEDTNIPLEIDGGLFISWIMVNSFYQPSFPPGKTPYLPLMITETARGNIEPLTVMAQDYWSGMIENKYWALGLLLTVNCQEAFAQADLQLSPEDSAASQSLDGYLNNDKSREICEAWSLPPVDPPAVGSINTDIPTLVLAGSYDPVTPPEWSKGVAAELPNSYYFEFSSAGHDVTLNNPCAGQLQLQFLQNPGTRPDASCMADVPGPKFVLPSDLYIAPGISISGGEVSLGDAQGIPWLEALSGASILILLVSILLLLVGGLLNLVNRVRNRDPLKSSATLAYFLTAATALLALSIPILLTRVNNHLLNQNALVRSFGVDREIIPATFLATVSLIVVLLFFILIPFLIWAWFRGKWSLKFRVLITIIVVAVSPIIYLGLRWDLFTMLL